MYLECTCVGIGMKRWNQLMKGSKPLNYEWLLRRIRKHMPDLYEALGLNFYNPYEEQVANLDEKVTNLGEKVTKHGGKSNLEALYKKARNFLVISR